MSEQITPNYDVLPEHARNDLRVAIGAFMLFEQAHVVSIKHNVTPSVSLTRGEVEGLLTPFASLDVYQEVRQDFINRASSGLPKHL